MKATNYEIAPTLEGNIHDIVPPLLEWSREMQMEPENLEKHVWTRYLKPLEKAGKYWHLQDRVKQPMQTSSAE